MASSYRLSPRLGGGEEDEEDEEEHSDATAHKRASQESSDMDASESPRVASGLEEVSGSESSDEEDFRVVSPYIGLETFQCELTEELPSETALLDEDSADVMTSSVGYGLESAGGAEEGGGDEEGGMESEESHIDESDRTVDGSEDREDASGVMAEKEEDGWRTQMRNAWKEEIQSMGSIKRTRLLKPWSRLVVDDVVQRAVRESQSSVDIRPFPVKPEKLLEISVTLKHLEKLNTLKINSFRIGSSGTAAVAALVCSRTTLHTIKLESFYRYDERNEQTAPPVRDCVSDSCLQILIDALRAAKSLTSISLIDNDISSAGFTAFFTQLCFTGLTQLTLSGCPLKERAVEVMATMMPCVGLQTLKLKNCEVGS